jgi:hypothetical protein
LPERQMVRVQQYFLVHRYERHPDAAVFRVRV